MNTPTTALAKRNGATSPALLAPAPIPIDRGEPVHPVSLEETFAELREMAGRKSGHVPSDLMAQHVIAVTAGGDWPLRRAAMEAVLRRCKFGDRDGLVVVRAPARGAISAATSPGARRRKASDPRQCGAAVRGSEPTAPSPDRIDHPGRARPLARELRLSGLPARLARALQAPALCARRSPGPRLLAAATRVYSRASPTRHATLAWDPVRPLRGAGERLLGLQWIDGQTGRRAAAVLRRLASGSLGARAPAPCPDSPAPRCAGGMRRFIGDLLEAAAGRAPAWRQSRPRSRCCTRSASASSAASRVARSATTS